MSISIKRMLCTLAVATLAFGTFSGVALGAEGDDLEAETKVFNFEGDTISTDFLKPGTMLIEGLRRGRRSSLIEVRLDFVAEILRSAEDI